MSVYIQCLKMSSLDHPWNNKALLLTGIEVYGLRFSVNKPVQLKNTKFLYFFCSFVLFCSLSSFKKKFFKNQHIPRNLYKALLLSSRWCIVTPLCLPCVWKIKEGKKGQITWVSFVEILVRGGQIIELFARLPAKWTVECPCLIYT